MAEPSVSEITSIRGDADMAYGSPAGGSNAVLPFSKGIDYLFQYGQNKMQADQFRYVQFQRNLENYMKDFGSVNVEGVMNKDYDELNREWAGLASDVYENYDIIRNPGKDPQKFAELKQREASLRGKIAQSKQDLLYVDAHKKFLSSDPSLNTEQNRSMISGFENGVLGGRELFNLNLPTQYDPLGRAKIAASVARRQLGDEQKQGKYLVKTEAEQYLKDKFLEAWRGTLSAQDRSGRTVQQQAEEAYGLLPKGMTANKTFEQLDDEFGLRFLPADSQKTSIDADPFALQDDQQNFQAWQNSLTRSLQRELNEDKTFEGVGRLYNESLTSAFTTGFVNPQFLQSVYGDNEQIELKNTTETLDAQGQPVKIEAGSKVPKVKVTGSKLVGDKLLISRQRYDAAQGKYVDMPDEQVTYDEARVAFTGVAGSGNQAKVADAAEKYRKQNNLGVNPDLNKMKEYFKLGQQTPQFNLNADNWKKK